MKILSQQKNGAIFIAAGILTVLALPSPSYAQYHHDEDHHNQNWHDHEYNAYRGRHYYHNNYHHNYYGNYPNYQPPVVYSPPPDYYYPPAVSPGFSLVIPLDIR